VKTKKRSSELLCSIDGVFVMIAAMETGADKQKEAATGDDTATATVAASKADVSQVESGNFVLYIQR